MTSGADMGPFFGPSSFGPSWQPAGQDIPRGPRMPPKRVSLSEYGVDVFDMSDPERRKAYCDLMKRLFGLVSKSRCAISRNELQVLNGSGWWRYVEWIEYGVSGGDVEDEEK